MLLKCCTSHKSDYSDDGDGYGQYEYQVCRNDGCTDSVTAGGSRDVEIGGSGGDEVDFTLKHVEEVIGNAAGMRYIYIYIQETVTTT